MRWRLIATGIGGALFGFLIYSLLAGVGGGIDWTDRLTLGQRGDFGLEGLGIFYGVVLGAVVGVPLGTYAGLKLSGVDRTGVVAWVSGAMAAAVSIPAWIATQGNSDDPIIAPYLVFGSWVLFPALVTFVFQRWFPKRLRDDWP